MNRNHCLGIKFVSEIFEKIQNGRHKNYKKKNINTGSISKFTQEVNFKHIVLE